MEGRTKLLVGTLIALLAVTAWRYLGPKGDAAPPASGRTLGRVTDPESLSDPVPGRRPARRSGEKKADSVEELRVADLQRPARDYTPGRDPWRFVEPPPPPPPPQPPQPRGPSPEELERMRQAQEELARQRAAELARQQAEEAARRPPPFTMAYLGNFGPPERRIAVFSDGQSIINAEEGEVIGGKFIVAHIGYESVDIKAVGYPDAPPQRLAVGRPSPSR